MSRANFVQVQLAAAATDIQTTLSVKAAVGGFVLPPADGGRLVLTDSPGRPNAFEVITYAGRTGAGPSYTLTGVVRGQEGTVGLTWGIDTYVVQALTVGELDLLLGAKVDKASGQSLMLNAERTKLNGISAGAQVNVATNLAQGARTSTGIPLTSSTGTGTTLPVATTTLAGLQSATDKSKLDGIAAGAQVNVATNLAQGTRTSTGLPLTSSTGTGTTLPTATTTLAGLQSAADKSKLDGIAAGAQVNTVTSVAGRTGAVTLAKPDVGLSNVDDTSDTAKPVSTAQQAALDGKVDKVTGKGLSTNDLTGALLTKLNGISAGAQVNVATNLAQGARTSTGIPLTSSTGTGTTLPVATTTLAGLQSATDKSKLDGIAAGAQVNVATNLAQGTRTSTGLPLTSSTGTGTTLPTATTTLAGLQSAADKSKLDGIAAGATANATDAQLRDRATHTGTQAIDTVTGLPEALNNKVGGTGPSGAALLPGGTQAQRPASPVNGMFRYNSEKHQFEGYQNGKWGQVGGGDAVLTPGWALSRASIGDGYAAQDGQLLSRATYPDAWAQAQAIGMVITDAEWLADPLKRGFFSSGDGSTTFRLPDANGKQAGSLGAVFLRGDGALSAGQAGLIQRDAMQPITGTMFGQVGQVGFLRGGSESAATGAFDLTGATTTASAYMTGSAGSSYPITFDSAKSPGSRTATETRALNLTVVWTIKLFGAVVNVGSADAAQLASDYANLAAALQVFESRYDSEVDFTIIYPNGGSEASPAGLAANTRYIETNPFPGHFIMCELNIRINGEWCGIRNAASGTNIYGGFAGQHDGDEIAVVTAGLAYAGAVLGSITGATAGSGVAWNSAAITGSRVLVWKVKGAVT